MPGDGDVLASIEAGEQAEIVRRTVGTLPRRYRDAVVLYYFSDMDVACAARSLGFDGDREGAAASCAVAARGPPLTYDGQELKEGLMHVDLDDAGIDRALREERSLEPSPQFAARVMRSVRDEAEPTRRRRSRFRGSGLGSAWRSPGSCCSFCSGVPPDRRQRGP